MYVPDLLYLSDIRSYSDWNIFVSALKEGLCNKDSLPQGVSKYIWTECYMALISNFYIIKGKWGKKKRREVI